MKQMTTEQAREMDAYRRKQLRIATLKAWGIALIGILVLPMALLRLADDPFSAGLMSAISIAGGIYFASQYYENESKHISNFIKNYWEHLVTK